MKLEPDVRGNPMTSALPVDSLPALGRTEFTHEKVLIQRGDRSGVGIILAAHSTALGPPAGGCRVWNYASWLDGLDDALRLSEAMSWKSALADLPLGGGKAVVALSPDERPDATRRRGIFLDLGDAVEEFGMGLAIGEDVGTTPEDLRVARERTARAHCWSPAEGGAGSPSTATARGVISALRVTLELIFGSPSIVGRSFTLIGAGQVGEKIARELAANGGRVTVSDIDPAKRGLASELGASWVEPADALASGCDVLIPAAMSGLLNGENLQSLACCAIVGPANNQLASEDVADLLHERGVVWAPDFLVNAGGMIHVGLIELLGESVEVARRRVESIGSTLRDVFAAAREDDITPYAAARLIVSRRLHRHE